MDFIKKIGDFFNGLNDSDLWGYIKNIIAKLKKLLGILGEDEAGQIVEEIFPEAE